MNYGLGRLPFEPDQRDASYTPLRLAAMLELGLAAPVEWANANPVLDQQKTPECVAFGTLGLLNTDDEKHNDPRFTNEDAHLFFKTIPGAGENGAQLRNGLKAAKAAGLVAAYALLNTEAQIAEWLDAHGPVLVGTIWTAHMMEPHNGIVMVDSTANIYGHCWYLHGREFGYLHGTNSWGKAWGEDGQFRISREAFTRLINARGEAWAVVQPPANMRPPRLSAWSRIRNLFRLGD
jgi:hypothetical protein